MLSFSALLSIEAMKIYDVIRYDLGMQWIILYELLISRDWRQSTDHAKIVNRFDLKCTAAMLMLSVACIHLEISFSYTQMLLDDIASL